MQFQQQHLYCNSGITNISCVCIRPIPFTFYNFLLFKNQNTNYPFFFLSSVFFFSSPELVLCLVISEGYKKLPFLWMFKDTEFASWILRLAKKSVRSHTERLLQILGSGLHSSEERCNDFLMSENKAQALNCLYILWVSLPACLLHEGFKKIGEKQETLVMPFQWLSSFSRGKDALVDFLHPHLSPKIKSTGKSLYYRTASDLQACQYATVRSYNLKASLLG